MDLAAVLEELASGGPRPMSGDEYVAWLRSFPEPDHEGLRRRVGPGGEPFRLP